MSDEIKERGATDAAGTDREATGERAVTFNRDTGTALTGRGSHEAERLAYAEFACGGAEADYRARLAEFYESWHRANADFFGGRLVEPHMAIGRTAPRSLGHCTKTTDYG